MVREFKIKWTAALILIIINVLFFVVVLPFVYTNPKNMDYIALKPSDILQGKYLWTFITSMFMHSPILFVHLLFNMMSLFFLGTFLEKIIGWKRFLFVYLVGGLIAGISFVAWAAFLQKDLNTAAVGASGAIFTLGGTLAVLTPKLPVYIMFIPIPVPLVFAIFLMFGLLALLPGIANSAHAGGLVVGLLYGIYLKLRYREKVRRLQRWVR